MTLKQYLKSKNCTITAFERECKIHHSEMTKIVNNRDVNITANTMRKIYKASKILFGEGLLPQDYLNIIDIK